MLAGLALLGCDEKKAPVIPQQPATYTQAQKDIIEEYVYNCADTHHYHSLQYQQCLDAGIAKDSTIAYLWQQKAMPNFKGKEYEVGMVHLDKAVKYKPDRYLPYRAFIKCIFAKTYEAAITDFRACLELHGNSYVMDHTYKFYIALSYLQLDQFEKAEKIFKEDIQDQAEEWGVDGVHHLDLFYYGISKYEQEKYEEAIAQFDRALELYPTFSDVMYYKANALASLGRGEEAEVALEEAMREGKAGNTINEANSVYETYPYQVKW